PSWVSRGMNTQMRAFARPCPSSRTITPAPLRETKFRDPCNTPTLREHHSPPASTAAPATAGPHDSIRSGDCPSHRAVVPVGRYAVFREDGGPVLRGGVGRSCDG